MATTREIREWYIENEIEEEEITVEIGTSGTYALQCSSASISTCGMLELNPRCDEMYLHNFHAYVTRVGIGTRLMRKALKICDELQKPCILIIAPDGIDIEYDDLLKFYLDFGFKETTRSLYGKPVFMRMPNLGGGSIGEK